MEQVISVIIMIAVGAFFAWIEKLSKKKAAATDSRLAAEAASRRSRRKAVMPPVPRPPSPPSSPAQLPVIIEEIGLPEEGARVTADPPHQPAGATPPAPPQSSANAAWRDRWRRAIIDSEILSPRF
ncbi:MAG: hypothetical protein HDS02_02505 [Bacteroides sp.]|nr:hypothetical protein [Bacteroides sp.]MDE7460423.1 hypothetical protein [Paramuribaculum sp.]